MAVLIGRGLDLKSNFGKALKVCFPLIFPSFLYSVFRALFQSLPFAPLAQLVEHLTLNQGVPGSSPGWVTREHGEVSEWFKELVLKTSDA